MKLIRMVESSLNLNQKINDELISIQKSDYEVLDIKYQTHVTPHGITERTAMIIYENSPKSVTISKDKYENLLDDQAKLNALVAAGVDNWEDYSYAMQMLGGEEDE